jgi:hypothetical protein
VSLEGDFEWEFGVLIGCVLVERTMEYTICPEVGDGFLYAPWKGLTEKRFMDFFGLSLELQEMANELPKFAIPFIEEEERKEKLEDASSTRKELTSSSFSSDSVNGC